MLKAILSLLGNKTPYDPPRTTAISSTTVIDISTSHGDYAQEAAESGKKPALADSHRLSEYISLPSSACSSLDRKNIAYGSDHGPDPDAAIRAGPPSLLGQSTDGFLKLYESDHTGDRAVSEKSQAQQRWEQDRARRDDRSVSPGGFGKDIGSLEHATLAEQVQRRGLWAGP